MITVTLKILFLDGTLRGVQTETTCTFPSRELADAYAEQMRGRIVRRPCGGSSPYAVEEARVS